MFDLIIKNGIVIDGSGAPRARLDVAIKDEKIVALENLAENVEAARVIDAAGQIVCPGFVDILDHSDSFWTLYTVPRLDSKIMQGVTTIIGGNCGSSLAPVLGPDSIYSIRKWSNSDHLSINWVRVSEFFAELKRHKLGLNFGSLVGHETLRRGIMGDEVRRITGEEIKMMGKMLYDALHEGALGMSTGLVFSHAKMSSSDEVKYLAQILRSEEALYASHIRGEAEDLLPSVNETIQIGHETGVSIEISHFKAVGQKYWSDMPRALQMINLASEEGVNVDFDIYPYDTTGSVLYIILPDWVAEGGRQKMLSRLKDYDLRHKIVTEMRGLNYDYDKLVISICPRMKEVVGKSIAELAVRQELSPEECAIELLIGAGGHAIVFDRGALSEANIMEEIKHPHCIIASGDAAYHTDYARRGELVHPRCFGTFARALGKYAREESTVTLEEIIYKMTLKPARKVGLSKRGLLQSEYFADVTIFDPNTVMDHATYENPYQYATGVSHVILNGKVVVEDGVHTGELAGQVLTK